MPTRQSDRQSVHDHLSPDVREKLGHLELRLFALPSLRAIWEQIFTADELATLGNNFVEFCSRRDDNLIAAYMRFRTASQYRATIELASELNFVYPAEKKWLLHETGVESVDRPVTRRTDIPIWDAERLELRLDGEVIRIVKRPNQARNVLGILEAFEKEHWKTRIDDPLPNGPDGQRLGAAVNSLNANLTRIRFERDGSGRGILWRQI